MALPCHLDFMSLRVTYNAYFSLLTHTKQLLLVTFCDLTAGILKWDGMDAADGGCHQDRQA